MNRLEIATQILSGQITYTDEGQEAMIEAAYQMADKIIKYQKATSSFIPSRSKPSNEIADLLTNNLEWNASPELWRWEQASVVLKECGFSLPSFYHSAKAGVFIGERNGGRSKRVNGRKLLLCPPIK